MHDSPRVVPLRCSQAKYRALRSASLIGCCIEGNGDPETALPRKFIRYLAATKILTKFRIALALAWCIVKP